MASAGDLTQPAVSLNCMRLDDFARARFTRGHWMETMAILIHPIKLINYSLSSELILSFATKMAALVFPAGAAPASLVSSEFLAHLL